MNLPRCVLFVVDALSHDIVRSMIELGELPSIKRLVEQGGRLSPCLSIFPSITPAATCSIMTGEYPRAHGIEGACWLDRDQEELAYFGDDVRLIAQRGFYDYILDFGDRLNFERLRQPTLFQQLYDQGVESLSVNSMWFAGPHLHSRKTPLALKLGAGSLPEEVSGPKYIKLGSFAETLPKGVRSQPSPSIINRYGFSDQVSIDCLLDVAKAGELPAMTVGYFPENDDLGHNEGIRSAADKALVRFDSFLGEFVEHFGGWDRIGDDMRLVIVGDHSQVEFGEDGPNAIRLDEWLHEFDQASVTSGWTAAQQLFICPNMRAAAIYLRDPSDASYRNAVIERLCEHDKIAMIAQESDDGIICVCNGRGQQFSFSKTNAANSHWTDDYENYWQMDGDPECVGLVAETDDGYRESDYPNPLERLYSAFVPGAKPIWVSATTDAEFTAEGFSTHQGGSHGSLHKVDSVSALITSAGIDLSVLPNQERPRIVDVATLCRSVFTQASNASS